MQTITEDLARQSLSPVQFANAKANPNGWYSGLAGWYHHRDGVWSFVTTMTDAWISGKHAPTRSKDLSRHARRQIEAHVDALDHDDALAVARQVLARLSYFGLKTVSNEALEILNKG